MASSLNTRLPEPAVARLGLAVLLCLVANALAIWCVLQPPWLGLRLEAADTSDGLVARALPGGPARILGGEARLLDLATYTGSGAIRLRPEDLAADPDVFDTYAQVDAFLARQAHIHALLGHPVTMSWKDAGGTPRLAIATPGWRPLSSLPARFWQRQAAASLVFLLGAWAWGRRRLRIDADRTGQDGRQGPDRGAGMAAALAGAAVMLAVFPASIYGARELAIDASTFRFLSALNHIGATLFGCVLLTLAGRYPLPLAKLGTLLAVNTIFIAWLLADLLRIAGNPDWGYRIPLLVQLVLALGLACRQWRMKSRLQ